jgi:hypothetical protein
MTRKQFRNPFIKSPQQLELEDAVKVFKIWFHMLDYGDPVDDRFHAFHMMLKVLHNAISGPDKETLAEAIAIFQEATEYNAWRKSYTKPVNSAMDVVLKRFTNLPKQIAQKALLSALETA